MTNLQITNTIEPPPDYKEETIMKTLENKNTKVKAAYTGIYAAVMTGLMTIMPLYADQISSQINSGLKKVYGILSAVVLPIAAIALAVCGIKMIWGDQRSAEAAKSALVKIIIGVGIVYLAPFLIETISGWFKGTSSSIW